MLYRTLLVLLSGLLIHTSSALAGNTYEVTSPDGKKSINYEVSFGGGKLMDAALFALTWFFAAPYYLGKD